MKRNHRIVERRRCAITLELTNSDWDEIERVRVFDLSLLGAGLATQNPFSMLEENTEIQLHVPGRRSVSGHVCWSRGQRGGVQFEPHWDEVLESWVGDALRALDKKTPERPVRKVVERELVVAGDCAATLHR